MTEVPPILPAAAELLPGYSVISHLSRGKKLDVYDVWSAERDCRCVAKVLRPDCRGDRAARRRLVQEGRLLLGASHPNIVRAYELVRRPQLAVILETLTGETLANVVSRRARGLSRSEVAFLGLHTASAVRYLHARNVIHMDLKPSNLVSHPDGRAIVIDLSICARPGLLRKRRGTGLYMAPEQFGGQRVGFPADVWGLGMVLFIAAAGIPPYLRREPDTRVASLREHRPRFPEPLLDLVDSCLATDPDRRPQLAEVTAVLAGVARASGPLTPVLSGAEEERA